MPVNFFKIALFASVANIASTPFSTSVAAVCGYIIIASFFTHVFSVFFLEKDKVKAPYLVCVCSVLSSVIASVPSLNWFTEENVLPLFFFLSFYCLILSNNSQINSLTLKDVYILNYVLSFVFLFLAFGPFDKKYIEFDEWGNLQYTLGLGNPNATSGYVLFAIAILCLQLKHENRKQIKIFNILLLIPLFVVMFLLSSRTSLFCGILLVLSFFFFPAKQKLFKLGVFFLSIPIIMIFFQISVIHGNFFDFTLFGKQIDSGRANLFLNVFDKINENPMMLLLGDFEFFHLKNTHNFALSILSSLGVIGVVTVFYSWIYTLNRIFFLLKTRVQENAYLFMFVFFVHSSSETMFLIGSIPFSLFFLVIIKIACGEITTEEIQKGSV